MPATPALPSEPSTPASLRVSGAVVVLASLVGLGLGAYLTVLKFMIEFLPCVAEGNTCAITSGMSCDDALHSPWAMLFGLPLSTWATAFYEATATLGLRPPRPSAPLPRRPRAPRPRRPRRARRRRHPHHGDDGDADPRVAVPGCFGLYAVSVVLLVAALAALRAPPSDGWRGLVARRPASRVDAVFLVLALFIGLVGAEAVAYQITRGRVDSDEGC
ncbi:MAG: vitamin K epoxide reductase family protein [Nannocystaceae bacterium]